MFKNRSPELELDKELDKEIKKEDTPEIPAIPSKPKKEKKQFIPPTQEEVINYVLEKQLVISPYGFFSYYSKLDWKDVQGNQVKSWKGKAVTWDSRD